MNVEETAREIARISPAAGREADKLVAEITRLNDENRSRSTTQEETKRRLAEYLWRLFEADVPEDMTASALWDEAAERVRELLPENQRRFKQMLEDQGQNLCREMHEALGRDVSARSPNQGFGHWRDWWINLHREVEELHALNLARVDRQEMQRRVLHKLCVGFDVASQDPELAEGINPTTDAEFNDTLRRIANVIQAKISRAEKRAGKAREIEAKQLNDLASQLSQALGGDAYRPESFAKDSEWFGALVTAAAEIRQAQQTEPLDIASLQEQLNRHSSALAVTHSALLEMQTEYQKERAAKVKARRDLQVALADVGFYKVAASDADMRLQLVDMALRGQMPPVPASAPYRTDTSARADRMFHDLKDAVETAERELNWRKQMTVQRDEADREVTRLHKVIAEGNATIDRLTSMKEAMGSAGDTDWSAIDERRKESTALPPQYADQRHYPTDAPPAKNAAVRFAECGQPYPCEHVPDGGNHPMNGARETIDRARGKDDHL